jgi:hypothetical protein
MQKKIVQGRAMQKPGAFQGHSASVEREYSEIVANLLNFQVFNIHVGLSTLKVKPEVCSFYSVKK